MKLFLALSVSAFAIVGPSSKAEELKTAKPTAARIAGAVPINPAHWVTTTDRERSGSIGEGVTRFELTISPAGSVEQCKITESSNFAALDQLTCSLMVGRAHFRSAKDQRGLPIASTFVNQVKWVRPGGTLDAPAPRPHFMITVERLPEPMSSPAYVRVLAIIDSDGQVENCQGQGNETAAVLNTIACQQLGSQMLDLIGHDKSGQPRRMLRSLLVGFSTGETPADPPTAGVRK